MCITSGAGKGCGSHNSQLPETHHAVCEGSIKGESGVWATIQGSDLQGQDDLPLSLQCVCQAPPWEYWGELESLDTCGQGLPWEGVA